MTEKRNSDEVVLNCSVSLHKDVSHTVTWLFNGSRLKDSQGLKISESHGCASLKLLTFNPVYEKRFTFLECEVTTGPTVRKFPFSLQPSGENNHHKHSVIGFVDYGIKLSVLSQFCSGEDTTTAAAEDVTLTTASPEINGSDATLFMFLCD